VERLARGGLKGLVGNRGYRRYLRIERAKVEIDEGALKREARYDGKCVLLTDGDLPAEEVALAYKGLWRVEAAFREPEVPLRVTRDASRVLGPIYHWTERKVRAHVAVCFLALLLEVELERRLRERGWGRASGRCFRTLCG
jgi:transposase